MKKDLISDHLAEWNVRWPNFAPAEPGIGCQGCSPENPCRKNRLAIRTKAMDALQRLRDAWRKPIRVNSSFRCAYWNARVNGAAKSRHRRGDAFDVSIRNMSEQDMKHLLELARQCGFTGFGFYGTFLHLDMGRPRHWFTLSGKKKWNFLVT